jgi:hypothetical protein
LAKRTFRLLMIWLIKFAALPDVLAGFVWLKCDNPGLSPCFRRTIP